MQLIWNSRIEFHVNLLVLDQDNEHQAYNQMEFYKIFKYSSQTNANHNRQV